MFKVPTVLTVNPAQVTPPDWKSTPSLGISATLTRHFVPFVSEYFSQDIQTRITSELTSYMQK